MKNPKITPEEIGLIKRAQAGSEPAFNRIFYKYKGFVDNLLFTYVKDMDEAKDLTNIVFLKVYDKLSKFTAYDSFGGWLRILAKNTAIDYLRTIKGKTITFDDSQSKIQLNSIIGNSETAFSDKMTYNYLIDKFNELPELYKKVAKLFYIDNLTVKQISTSINVPEGTIKSCLHRTRKQLKKQLKLC